VRRVLAVAALAFLAACYPELDWREFTWPQGRFSVLLPGRPAHGWREVALAGRAVRMDMVSVQIKGLAFGVAYADLPADADPMRVINESRDALIRNISGRITTEHAVEIDGARGIEFEAEGATQEARMRLAARILVGAGRFYQIVFVGREERAAAVDTALFLGSFKLVK
jgi:hypothetical protein